MKGRNVINHNEIIGGGGAIVAYSPIQSRTPITIRRAPRKKKVKAMPQIVSARLRGGVWFRHEGVPDTRPMSGKGSKGSARRETEIVVAKTEKTKPVIDPRLKSMSRQLRDQWTKRAAATDATGIAGTNAIGKYNVTRLLAA